MGKKGIILLGVLAGIGAIGYGMYIWFNKQIEGAMNYCYKFSKINIISLKKERIAFTLNVKVKQNSDIRLTLTGYEFDVLINGRKIIKLSEDREIEILPKAVSNFTTTVDFNPSNMFNIADLISLVYYGTMERDKFIIEIVGKLNVKANFLEIKDLPMNIKMTLAEIMAPANEADEKNYQCKIY